MYDSHRYKWYRVSAIKLFTVIGDVNNRSINELVLSFNPYTAITGASCFIVNISPGTWLSGTWFSLYLVGEAFKTIAYLLPFSHAVNAGRYALAGEYAKIIPDLIWVIGYAVIVLFVAVSVFTRKMNSDNT